MQGLEEVGNHVGLVVVTELIGIIETMDEEVTRKERKGIIGGRES